MLMAEMRHTSSAKPTDMAAAETAATSTEAAAKVTATAYVRH